MATPAPEAGVDGRSAVAAELVKFARHFLAVTCVVVVVFFIGVALEHSPLSQAVAPHADLQQHESFSVVKRDGQVYVEVVTGSKGHEKTVLHKARGVPTAGHPVDLGGSRGSPFNPSGWPQAAAIAVVILVGAGVVALLDRRRRSTRRRTRATLAGA